MAEIDLPGLIAALRSARPSGHRVAAPAGLGLEDGVHVLRSLASALLAAGDEVVGWKIGTIPADGGDEKFAAPVFASSLAPATLATLISPRVEIELVATLTDSDGALAFDPTGWHVGAEVIDNHDLDGPVSLPWAVADWGFHAAAAYGELCDMTELTATGSLRLDGPEGLMSWDASWSVDPSHLLAVIDRYAPQTARPCRAGDLVWTGSVRPPMPLVSAGTHAFWLEHWGSVRLEVA